jgi:hypothetical protein
VRYHNAFLYSIKLIIGLRFIEEGGTSHLHA